jgi:DNA-binding transcriptional LysR family regulator
MCAAPSFLDARGRPRRPEDLEGRDCIATVEGVASVRAYRFRTAKGEISVPMRSRLTVSEIEAAIDACKAGLGLMRVLSYQVVAAQREGTLELVLEDFEPKPWPVHIVYLGQGLLPLKLRAFLDFATPRLRVSLSASG